MPCNFVGPPVRGSDCYGREAFVDLVWEKLSFGHVLLASPRRDGTIAWCIAISNTSWNLPIC